MKPIEARDQVRLGLKRCVELSLTGMAYRMFRSMITVSILALAVAFLVHMLAYGLIAQETKRAAFLALQDSRTFGEWVLRLSAPDAEAVILQTLTAKDESARLRLAEYRAWANLAAGDLTLLQEAGRRTEEAGNYIESLPVSTRVVLTGDSETESPLALFKTFSGETEFALFRKRLEDAGLKPPLGDISEFEALVRDSAPKLSAFIALAQAGQAEAIRKIAERFPDQNPRTLLAGTTPEFAQALVDAGFQVPPDLSLRIADSAAGIQDTSYLAQQTATPEFRRTLAKLMKKRATMIDDAAVLQWLDRPERAELLAAELAQRPGPDGQPITADRLLALADAAREQEKLERIAGDEIPADRKGPFDLPSGTQWLIAVSFLVCAVGVANAMLMSVTERFSEIATMKCLGALNGFVMQVFFFEAVLQGMLGGIVGVIAGMLLAFVRAGAEFGALAFSAMPARDLAAGALVAWGVGIVLAAAAAIGPVWVAARLAPMEAMRVE